jgi:hypothetical protein
VRETAIERFATLDVEGSPFFTRVTNDPEGALAPVAEAVGMPPSELRSHPNVLAGTADEIVDLLELRRETLGVNYVSVQQSDAEALAPDVARLAGK